MMKHILLFLLSFQLPLCLMGQGSGIGYTLDMGGSLWSHPSPSYWQSMGAYTHNGFLRLHNENGKSAFQLMVGYKTEYTAFQNYCDFLAPTGTELMNYSTDAMIERTSWKFGLAEQTQFGSDPGGMMVFSVNYGIFYERTVSAKRFSDYDNIRYSLVEELNPHGFGYTFGSEMRFYIFTFGYKVEQLFRDVLDHDYILSQQLNVGNSSELRGLMLHPTMHYVYIGINFDAFRK